MWFHIFFSMSSVLGESLILLTSCIFLQYSSIFFWTLEPQLLEMLLISWNLLCILSFFFALVYHVQESNSIFGFCNFDQNVSLSSSVLVYFAWNFTTFFNIGSFIPLWKFFCYYFFDEKLFVDLLFIYFRDSCES